MALTTGVCTSIEILRYSGKVWVQAAGETTSDLFLMWYFLGSRDLVTGEDVSAFDRVRHSMWVSLLQRAMESGQPVTISHDASGAYCYTIAVGS